MTFPTPHTLTVRRTSTGDADSFGNARETTTEHPWRVYFVAPGSLQGGVGDGDDGVRDLSKIVYSVGAPKTADVPGEYDEVLVDDQWLHVNGRPQDFTRCPWGFAPGVVVELEVANG